MTATPPVGDLLRTWRQRRRMTQLDLAIAAGISPRHLSFLETGRSLPSRAMLLRLAERLQVPLRERNPLFMSAGFAPLYSQKRLDDPELAAARRAIELVLAGHEPYPALAVDRRWNLVLANRTVGLLLDGAEPRLLEPPVNVLRLALHPGGIAPRIENYAQLRTHLLSRLRQQHETTADADITALLAELESYPPPPGHENPNEESGAHEYGGVAVPLRLRTDHGTLDFFSTITVFGTPLDITLAEIAVESFFPANAETAELLRRIGSR